MRFQSFGAGERCDGRSQFAQSGGVELLDGDDLDVVGGGEPSAQTRGAVGGQNVIGPGGVVARGFRAERPDEDAAGVADFRDQFFVVDREVFGSECVREFDGFVEGIAPE